MGIALDQLEEGVVVTHVASVTLIDAQIKALPGVGGQRQILAALGEGILPVNVVITLLSHFEGGAYTNLDTSSHLLGVYGADSSALEHGVVLNESGESVNTISAFLGSTTPKLLELNRLVGAFAAPSAGVIPFLGGLLGTNTPLMLKALNSGDYTGGDAANTLDVMTTYFAYDTVAKAFV